MQVLPIVQNMEKALAKIPIYYIYAQQKKYKFIYCDIIQISKIHIHILLSASKVHKYSISFKTVIFMHCFNSA